MRRFSFFYFAGLSFTALAMLLLPLLYIGLIVLTAIGVYYYAIFGLVILKTVRPVQLSFALYLGPMVGGVMLVAIMLKPFFARRIHAEEHLPLSREKEPTLFAFVDKLCRVIGAPQPKEIQVNMEVNASARLKSWALNPFSNDLVLTVGLPLASGMTVGQLSGILAHEFGHFTQRGAMRLTNIIHSIHVWFLRAVYERDSWDASLERSAEDSGCFVGLTLGIARLCIWFSRRILWLFMKLGEIISCFMLRQMEYDADWYINRFSGLDVFKQTFERLSELSVASDRLYNELGWIWNEEKRLIDDWSSSVSYYSGQLDDQIKEELRRHRLAEKRAWFTTHPTHNDRVAHAQRIGSDGLFHCTLPATVLFSKFTSLSKLLTRDYYENVWGIEVKPEQLHPLEYLLEKDKAAQEQQTTLQRFFLGSFAAIRPYPLPRNIDYPSASREELQSRLNETRNELVHCAAQYKQDYERYTGLADRLTTTSKALTLLQAGLSINAKEFNVKKAKAESVTAEYSESLNGFYDQTEKLTAYESLTGLRLGTALQLLFCEPDGEDIADAGRLRLKTQHLLPSARAIHDVLDDLIRLRLEWIKVQILLYNVQGNENNETLINATRDKTRLLHRSLSETLSKLSSTIYPYNHADGEISLRHYLCKELPPVGEVYACFSVVEHLLDLIYNLRFRIFSDLAAIAETVESACGFQPLVAPAQPEKE